jgi:transposase InsO family protein
LIPDSDRGVQRISIKYTVRLVEAGIEPLVGSVGDSYDNALAKTVIGPCKTEITHHQGPRRSLAAVEIARDELGRLVLQPSTARLDRRHATGRGRNQLPRSP